MKKPYEPSIASGADGSFAVDDAEPLASTSRHPTTGAIVVPLERSVDQKIGDMLLSSLKGVTSPPVRRSSARVPAHLAPYVR